jgi:outer membrane receptor protein involved in Fe transport
LPHPEGSGAYLLLYPPGGCSASTPAGCTPIGYKVLSPIAASGRFEDNVPTGKIDLNWTPLPGQTFYVFYARGYQSDGANASPLDHPQFQHETVNDYEAGWKGRVLDGHMLSQVGSDRPATVSLEA